MPVTAWLEELRIAFIERGCAVDRHLKPGLSRAELVERTESLGLIPPDDLVEMYTWRNGQGEDAEMSLDALVFRDNKFTDLDGALRAYPLIQEYYAPEPTRFPTASICASAFRSRRSWARRSSSSAATTRWRARIRIPSSASTKA